MDGAVTLKSLSQYKIWLVILKINFYASYDCGDDFAHSTARCVICCATLLPLSILEREQWLHLYV